MKTIKALFTLKPHGDNLCGLKAEMWLLLLRGSVLLIAGCEAAAWGFIGYLMAEATHPWVAAVLIGGAVGCLIGGLDAAFVMIDFSQIRRVAIPATNSDDSSRVHRLLSYLGRNVTKAHFGAIARMVMVAVSLMITAPFLAQLLFSRDIAARQQSINNKALAAARAAIATRYQQQEQTLQEQLRRLEDNRSREIAGRGLSRRFGVGPVTKSLTAQIGTLREQIDALERQSADDLLRFDHADAQTLARQYNVSLTSDGIVARFEALRGMEKIPGFRWTENAFRILLAGFFFGLIIFKWYEPHALEIYFNEKLQNAFEDFQAGRYDQFLVDPQLAPRGKISPFLFEKWYYDSIKVREDSQKLKDRLVAITARQNDFELAANQLSGNPGQEMQELQIRRSEILNALEPLRAALQKESDEAERIVTEIAECEARLASAPAKIAAVQNEDDMEGAYALLTIKRSWEKRLREAKVAQRRQVPLVAEAQRRYDSRHTELKDLDTLIAASARALTELTNGIINARVNAVHDLSAAQQEI
ncbi:MAG TPA: hypothetical protein VGM86_02990 [Thermoanaerobaculia bacterium]|jgi:hypothetical protein